MAEARIIMFHVYFLKSEKNDKIYTGCTSKDPKVRLSEHNGGSNSWSKNNGPFKLIYYEKYFCEKDARNREKFYKTGIGRLVRSAIFKVLKKDD